METEPGEPLKTWRLAQAPQAEILIAAEALPEHHRLYLDYEGPISGNRGEVKRWDFSEVQVLSESQSEILLNLAGRRIDGRAVLTQTKESDWTFKYSECDPSDGLSG